MEKKYSDDCIFCLIAAGKAPSKKIWENEDFLAIENKFPEAPIDILVLPKAHLEKSEARTSPDGYWDSFMKAIWEVVSAGGYDRTGYVLQNNGAGYNHLEHEHMHILSGMPKPTSA
jgi:histidine triad (HIT) family protein